MTPAPVTLTESTTAAGYHVRVCLHGRTVYLAFAPDRSRGQRARAIARRLAARLASGQAQEPPAREVSE